MKYGIGCECAFNIFDCVFVKVYLATWCERLDFASVHYEIEREIGCLTSLLPLL